MKPGRCVALRASPGSTLALLWCVFAAFLPRAGELATQPLPLPWERASIQENRKWVVSKQKETSDCGSKACPYSEAHWKKKWNGIFSLLLLYLENREIHPA